MLFSSAIFINKTKLRNNPTKHVLHFLPIPYPPSLQVNKVEDENS
jgi:hypothetical protein